jgi:hypothetical protein
LSKPLPRIAIVVPSSAVGIQAAAAALQELRSAPSLWAIAVGPLSKLPGAVAIDPTRALDELARVRANEGTSAIEPSETESAEDAAKRLFDEGRVDGIVTLSPPPGGPRLRLREGIRVVECFPGTPTHEVAAKLSTDLVAIAESANATLLGLGVSAPRIALFDLDGAPILNTIADAARSQGVTLLGPYPPARAVSERADALLALTPSQVELPLALRGTGPETGLSLTSLVAWPAEVGARATVLAAGRLARVLSASGAPLAEARDLARKPSVSIKSRSKSKSASTRTPGIPKDRCPYCHRLLNESADGSAGRPGPPVTCAECGTPHHRDCATEHGQCTVLGCRSTRMVRMGVTIPVSRLGGEAPAEHRFGALCGAATLGPHSLRVEAPLDDPDARPPRRRLGIELAAKGVRRGEFVDGCVVVWAPQPFRVRGGTLRLAAALSTRHHQGSGLLQTPTRLREEPILAREASFVGLAPAGALGRLQDGVVGLFSKTGVPIPSGIRRYPFSFKIDSEHPATVNNRQGDVEESVTTLLEATLDTQKAQIALDIHS